MTGTVARASACLLIFVASALPLAAGKAAAAEDEPYLVEYRAYSKALKAGDNAGAATHAHAAWQAAEDALGDHRLTAILAYNYGRLILFDDGEAASTPLRRARELNEAGIGDFSANEVRLYADYAEFAAGGHGRRQANRLRESLGTTAAAGAEAHPDLAVMWLRLATSDVAHSQYRDARESAARAEAAIRLSAPDNSRGLATAILLGAVARLVPYPREVEDVQAAHNEFGRARRLFPPQDDLDGFDPLLAKIIAWDSAANAALQTLGVEDYPDHAEAEGNGEPPLPAVFRSRDDPTLDCADVEWEEREAPDYPRSALRDGQIGAVLIGFRLGEDLGVHDARILAEVPLDKFGDGLLESLSEWRAKEMPSDDPACYRNLVTTVQFIIER